MALGETESFESDTAALMRLHSKPYNTLTYLGSSDNKDAKEYHALWVHAVAAGDRWRGIASAMGYEPKAHKDAHPTAKWLLDRIAKYRTAVASEVVLEARKVQP